MRRTILLATALALGTTGCSGVTLHAAGRSHAMPAYESAPLTAAEIGASRLVFDDFDGLSTDTLQAGAVPWKIAATALLLSEAPDRPPTREALLRRLRDFGMFVPTRVENWPGTTQPTFDLPVGLVTGDLQRRFPTVRLEAAVIGCASCHAGTLYDAEGAPTFAAWLGTPNTSLDLDGFVDAIYAGLRTYRDKSGPVLEAIPRLFPGTSKQELATIRRFAWPRLVRRIGELERAGGPLPFRNGGPGRSNGMEQIKQRLGVAQAHAGDLSTVSIPALGDRRLRTSLLVDGLYALPDSPHYQARTAEAATDSAPLADIAVFFTTITMGVPHRQAPANIARMREVLAYLDARATRPSFPGPIDAVAAAEGAAVYATHCAGCHGTYAATAHGPRLQSFPNRLVALDRIGTDAGRLSGWNASVQARFDETTFGRYIDAAPARGYVAPILTGAWATAPYLHNGSVPTLWHLLHPQARPVRFMVGGHRLDVAKVGVAGEAHGDEWRYPVGYAPWSRPQLFDTTQPGHSRAGHARQVEGLSEQDKQTLLEFLKTL